MATSIKYLQQMLGNKNIRAALMTIRRCEGTAGADGHQYLFGSKPDNDIRFRDFTKHPNVRKPYVNKAGERIVTSAAGAYQIIYGTYNMLCRIYGFTDFSPATQDLMAVAIFDMVNCLKAVADGRFFEPEILDRLNDQWASLPGAGYNQPEKSVAVVQGYYTQAGGAVV